MFPFYTPWKRQETKGFLMSGDIEWNIWLKWVQTFICIYKDRIYLIFYLFNTLFNVNGYNS